MFCLRIDMVAQTDLAWRLLEITALALPALAILMQVLLSMSGDRQSKVLHYYSVTTYTLFLIVPLSITGVVSIGVILKPYQVGWLAWAIIPMGFSFLFLPLLLFLTWRERRRLFEDVFLQRQKEMILEDLQKDDLPEEEVSEYMHRIESHQRGLLWNFRNPDKSVFVRRLNKIFSVISLMASIILAFTATSLLVRIFAAFLIATSSIALLDWQWTKGKKQTD